MARFAPGGGVEGRKVMEALFGVGLSRHNQNAAQPSLEFCRWSKGDRHPLLRIGAVDNVDLPGKGAAACTNLLVLSEPEVASGVGRKRNHQPKGEHCQDRRGG
jgi:hypothetical protein